MTDMKNEMLGSKSTFTDDPTAVAAVMNRKNFVSWALDKACVPVDAVSGPALLEMAIGHFLFTKADPKWVAQMLREIAAKIELMHTKPTGKPN